MIPEQVGRYLRTVRHLTPAQVAHRARLLALRQTYVRLPALTLKRYENLANQHVASWRNWTLLPGATLVDASAADSALHEAREIASGTFRFVNRAAELGAHPAWRDHGQSQLWSYHLH
jgi:hypothetical protein